MKFPVDYVFGDLANRNSTGGDSLNQREHYHMVPKWPLSPKESFGTWIKMTLVAQRGQFQTERPMEMTLLD